MNDNTPWRAHRDELLTRVVRRGKTLRWHRRLATLGCVVLVALVPVVAYGATREDPGVVVDGETPVTSTTVADRPGVLTIGDSVMLGAKPALEATVPGVVVDAVVSRQMGHVDDILRYYKSEGVLPGVVVVHAGYNGRFSDREFDAVMRAVGAETEVYFLTARVARAWEGEVNESLRDGVERWEHAHLLDWRAYAGAHHGWFAADGFHLTESRTAAYAAFVRDGIEPGAG